MDYTPVVCLSRCLWFFQPVLQIKAVKSFPLYSFGCISVGCNGTWPTCRGTSSRKLCLNYISGLFSFTFSELHHLPSGCAERAAADGQEMTHYEEQRKRSISEICKVSEKSLWAFTHAHGEVVSLLQLRLSTSLPADAFRVSAVWHSAFKAETVWGRMRQKSHFAGFTWICKESLVSIVMSTETYSPSILSLLCNMLLLVHFDYKSDTSLLFVWCTIFKVYISVNITDFKQNWNILTAAFTPGPALLSATTQHSYAAYGHNRGDDILRHRPYTAHWVNLL